MKRLHCFLVTLFVIALCGCEKSSEVSVGIDNAVLEFGYMGGTQTISVNSDADWSIYGVPKWLSLSAMSGIKNKEVNVIAVPNNTGLDREQVLTVRGNDNKTTWAIRVIQYADARGRLLNVDDTSEKYFNGGISLEYEDSIILNSSVRWRITGPSWLHMKFNNITSEMNGELREGSGVIYLMTAKNNTAAASLLDNIQIRAETDDVVINIPVIQLGVDKIKCMNVFTLIDGIACEFKCGQGVKSFRINMFEGIAPDSELTIEKTAKWPEVKDPLKTVYLPSGLVPGTNYTICTRGKNSETNIYKYVNKETFVTATEVNQPRAEIYGVSMGENGWEYKVKKNSFAKAYYSMVMKNWINLSTTEIAYRMLKSFIGGNRLDLNYNNTHSWQYTLSDIVIVTWAIGEDDTLSNVVDVFKAYLPENKIEVKTRRQNPIIEKSECVNIQHMLEDYYTLKE